jgi:hypothetical protein
MANKVFPLFIVVLLFICSTPSSHSKPITPDETSVSPIVCNGCSFVLTWIDAKLKDNATEAEIEDDLEDFCENLPHQLNSTCWLIAADYLPEIFYYLNTDVSPSVICSKIGLCPSNIYNIDNKKGEKYEDFCTWCDLAALVIVEEAASNGTEVELETLLDDLCAALPVSVAYQQQCEDVVEAYLPQLLQLIKEQNPHDICTRIGLCPSFASSSSSTTPISSVDG